MSGASPPIISAPVPPSIAGIAQPVIVAGGESLPPSFPLGTAGTWLPPPQVGFGGNAPFPTPVVPPAASPPSVAGFPQPQFVTGDIATPATMFPDWTLTAPPSPPIVFANIFNMGNVAPPSTPTTPVIPWSGAVTPTALTEPEEEARSSRSVNAEAVEPEPPVKRSHHAKGKPHGRAHRH